MMSMRGGVKYHISSIQYWSIHLFGLIQINPYRAGTELTRFN